MFKSETHNRLNEIKYKQKQENEQLEEEIARLEQACNEKESNIKILDSDSAKQYEDVVRAIEAINSIKQKVHLFRFSCLLKNSFPTTSSIQTNFMIKSMPTTAAS